MQNYLPITVLSRDDTAATSNLSHALQHGMTVYSTVVCSNNGGLVSSRSSDGVTILYDPPTSGNAYLSISSPTLTAYTPRLGYVPTAAMTPRWEGFAESAGTPLEYQLQVLQDGVTGQANWTSVSFAKMVSIEDLQLSENTTHAIQIRAVNLGGVASPAIQHRFAIVSSAPQDTGWYNATCQNPYKAMAGSGDHVQYVFGFPNYISIIQNPVSIGHQAQGSELIVGAYLLLYNLLQGLLSMPAGLKIPS